MLSKWLSKLCIYCTNYVFTAVISLYKIIKINGLA